MIIIGIGYKARQGKDIIAREMVKHAGKLGLYAKQYGFAGALKVECRIHSGMKDKDPRLLQKTGVWYRSNIRKSFWVDMLDLQLKEEQPGIAIITDVRFFNELEFIRSNNGKLIKVVRKNPDGSPVVASDRDPNHSSESELDSHLEWDYIVTNVHLPATFADARAALEDILQCHTT